MTLIGRSFLLLLSLASFLLGGSEPYRIRLTSSASKARLVGIANTPTAGLTVDGTYTYTLLMHDFPVAVTGNYILQEDPLGGTSYVTRADWSDATGKFILGKDAITGIYGDANTRFYNGVASLLDSPSKTYPLVNAIGANDVVTDTTLHLHSRMTLNVSQGYKVDWKANRYNKRISSGALEFGNVLFYSACDTNVSIIGGEYYGHSDDNYIDGDVSGAVLDSSKVYIDDVDVVADSLIKWYIRILSGTGADQTRRIESNTATAGGSTLITVSTKWVTPPDSTSNYRLTPMEEYQSAFDINKGNNISITNAYIHDFPGDGIAITGGSDIIIDRCIIQNPRRWFYAGGSGNYQNLVGRQGITIGGGSSGNWYAIPDTTAKLTGLDTLKNVKITRSKIMGGFPGGLDIEPSGRLYIENFEISECEIQNTPGQGGSAIIIYLSDSCRVKNLIIRDNIIKSDGVGIWLQNATAERLDSTTVSEAIDATEYLWDVVDGSDFANDDYIIIGTDDEFCRVDTVIGNTLTLYNSEGHRISYNGVVATTHLSGTAVYKMSGAGSDYGYLNNVQITGNTIIPLTPGVGGVGMYVLGAGYRSLKIDNNMISGWSDRGFEVTGRTYDTDVTRNRIFDNGRSSGLANNFYNSGSHRVNIQGNKFRDNGVVSDSSGSQLYISGVSQLLVKDNLFSCSRDCTIAWGLNMFSCDSVMAVGNITYGHCNDNIAAYAVTNYKAENNITGFSSATTSDSLSADMNYDYGNSEPGDTTAALYNETKRTSIRFLGFRDVGANFIGTKIVSQTTANPGYSSSPWKVQNDHLLFYTLGTFPNNKDDSRLRAIITSNGFGLADSSYISFFPKNSMSNTDPDTLWKYIGANGYGIRDSSGYLQFKNSGGSWTRFGSYSASSGGDVVGPASAYDNALARFNLTTGKLIQNSNAYLDDSGILSLGTSVGVSLLTVKTSLSNGITVTKESIPAGTDSCAHLGVVDGAGTLTLHAGGTGHNSSITVDTNDYMVHKNAAVYQFIKKGTATINVSGENVFTGLDSLANLYVNASGNGAVQMFSGDNAGYGTHSGTIQVVNTTGKMQFDNWDNGFLFNSNIEAGDGVVYKSITADPSSGTGMFIRNINSADADTLVTRDASGNIKRWISN